MRTPVSQLRKDTRKAAEIAVAGLVLVAQAAVFVAVVTYLAQG